MLIHRLRNIFVRQRIFQLRSDVLDKTRAIDELFYTEYKINTHEIS